MSSKQQPDPDAEHLAMAGRLIGQDPATADVFDLIDGVLAAAQDGTLPDSSGNVPPPPHVTQAADWPQCPDGADPELWERSPHYKAGWIDWVAAERPTRDLVGQPDYQHGMSDGRAWLVDWELRQAAKTAAKD
jgi:hypothetical protein